MSIAPASMDASIPSSPFQPPYSWLLTPSILLEGFRLLLQFLLDEEADYLCGAPLCARSPRRTNHRMGTRKRTLRTHLGIVSLCIPVLRYFHHRVPITKRAKRLAPGIFEDLARIHAIGAMPGDAAALIKTLWTLELPAALHAALAEKLTPILEQWRGKLLTTDYTDNTDKPRNAGRSLRQSRSSASICDICG